MVSEMSKLFRTLDSFGIACFQMSMEATVRVDPTAEGTAMRNHHHKVLVLILLATVNKTKRIVLIKSQARKTRTTGKMLRAKLAKQW